MQQAVAPPLPATGFGTSFSYFARPLRILRSYQRPNLRFDLVAGLTVGVILLPQALVFSVMAGLPPQMGLNAAVVAGIIGALWGSSNHLQTGPTNTSSLLIYATLAPLAVAGSPEYVAAAGLLTLMVGALRLSLGLLRLGLLVNFVSDAVIVGFTAGAGILILVSQSRALLGLQIPDNPQVYKTLAAIALNLPQINLISAGLGLGAIIFIVLLPRLNRRLPASLIVILIASVLVALLNLADKGVRVIGALHSGLPHFTLPPLLDLSLIGDLSTGALAIAVIGLVEATSISRAIAAQSRQRLDNNQEFIGQGLANIVAGLFSGYAGSGSFNRSAALYQSGGRTGLASASAGVFVLLSTLLLGKLLSTVPNTVLAAILIVNAYGLINQAEIARIWRSTRGETAIMVATFLGTLLLPLQFAVLTGILMSLAHYILKTSTPQVLNVLPDDAFKHFLYRPERSQCPQLAVMEIRGDLYFGAVSHVEETILANKAWHPGQQFLLLRMHNVQHIDISGIHMLESVVKTYRDAGGDVFLVKVRPLVLERMRASEFEQTLGGDHFLEDDRAITHIFHHVLDPAVCIYECETRAFFECQNLPRLTQPTTLTTRTRFASTRFPTISPQALYAEVRSSLPPVVIDVRELREFRRGHIPGADSLPLSRLLLTPTPPDLPKDSPIVFACRTGRRSQRAAQVLHELGYSDLRVLEGGMLGWETAALLQAVEEFS